MIQCGFCGKKTTLAAGMKGDWLLSYWFDVDGELVQSKKELCPKCAVRHCHDPDGTSELVVLPGHERYLKHEPAYESAATTSRRSVLRKLRGRR